MKKEVAKEKKTKSQKEEIIRRRKSIFPADFFELAHLGREREAIYYLTEKGIKLRGSERERERESFSLLHYFLLHLINRLIIFLVSGIRKIMFCKY